MNARGIPTAAYQVLHLLSWPRWGTPPSGYPPPRSDGGVYLRWGTLCPGPTGGYPRWGRSIPPRSNRGYPTSGMPPIGPGQGGGGYPTSGTPCQGYPPPRSDRVYLRWGTHTPPLRSDGGYPRWGTPIRVPPSRSDGGIPEVGYPPSDLAGVPPI